VRDEERGDHEGCRSSQERKPGATHAARNSTIAAAICWALGALGCTPAPAGTDANRPIELVVTNDAETIDPRYAVDAVGLRTTRLLHAGLVRLDPETLEPVPYLARSWRWIDPLTLRVELRDDVSFRSGHAFTSADVVATLEAFASPAVGSRHARVVEPIARVIADGDHAVVITLKRPHATLLTDLELPILRAEEAALKPSPLLVFDNLGPFSLASFARGEIKLVPRAHGPLPEPARPITIRTVHDENARALRLLGGRSDVELNVLSPALLPALAKEKDVRITARPGANLTYLVMRVDRPPLQDVVRRRAVSLAIDREAITSNMLAGYAHPATTLLPEGHWAWSAAPPAKAFDPVAARGLLAPTGAFHVTLLTSTDRLRIAIARVIAQQLAEVGVTAEVTPLELGTMIARLNAGDFDAAILQIPELAEPNVLRVFLHGTYVPPNGSNRGRVRDAEVDRLLDAGDAALEKDARRAIYMQLEARLRDQLYIVPLWHEDQVAVTTVRAAAFRPSAEGRWLSLAGLK
jgi:peptide/nickel transport system substrate-binding protein